MSTIATIAVGTTTLYPLMLELRTKLRTKQAKELKIARVELADIRCKKHMRYMLSLNACSMIQYER